MLGGLINEFELFKMIDGGEDNMDGGCECTCGECECTCDQIDDEYTPNPFNTVDDCECSCDEIEDDESCDECSCDEIEDDECSCDEIEDDESGDDFQGVIRTVKGANMVYKRSQDEGTFEELWLYNIGKDVKQNHSVKRAIIAGTDIAPENLQSSDGSQKMELYSVGNVQFLHIKGLPN